MPPLNSILPVTKRSDVKGVYEIERYYEQTHAVEEYELTGDDSEAHVT